MRTISLYEELRELRLLLQVEREAHALSEKRCERAERESGKARKLVSLQRMRIQRLEEYAEWLRDAATSEVTKREELEETPAERVYGEKVDRAYDEWSEEQ